MSTFSIPVIKFLFTGEFRVLNETLTAQPSYQVEEFTAVNDLATYLSSEVAGLVIASLQDKNDLVQIATLMKIVKKVAKDTTLKIVVINFSGDKQFEKAIAKLGIQDIMEPAINAKALKFKLDFWMKSLQGQIKNNPNAHAQKNAKPADTSKNNDKKVEANTPLWLEPLELEDDIWILKNENDCKKILSKWLIRLLGPSPYVGQWNDVQPNLWRFEIKASEKDLYVPGGGHWYYHGEIKPDFVWKENVWLITGDSFDLFYKDGPQVYSRLKCKDKNLTVAKNSLFAKTKEQIIAESFDKELVFKKEAQTLDDLEGKGKTDSINGGPLSGKNKTSHLNNGPLSGEINPEDQLLSSDALSQKASNDKQSSFWQGKNSYEKDGGDGKGPASEGVRQGSSLEQDLKNSDHQKYYKNHNEAEKYEAEKKEHERTHKPEAPQSGNMSGKSSTDEIDGFYDNDKDRKSAKEKKDRDLSGKSETDKLNSHYNNADRKEGAAATDASSDSRKDSSNLTNEEKAKRQKEEIVAKERAANEKAAFEQNKTRTAMAGIENSNTTGKGKLSSEDGQQTGAMRGRSSTEELAGHYKNAQSEKAGKKDKDQANDPYESLFGKSKDRRDAPSELTKKQDRKVDADYAEFDDSSLASSFDENQNPALADVLQLNKARAEKLKNETFQEVYDPELAETSADAEVISVMSFNKQQIECKMDDFFDETIIFRTTDGSLSPSSKVDMDMSFKYLNKDTQIKFVGDVITIEGDGEGSNYVTVQLSKQNVEAFDEFMRLYKTRQQNATAFLRKVKGL